MRILLIFVIIFDISLVSFHRRNTHKPNDDDDDDDNDERILGHCKITCSRF